MSANRGKPARRLPLECLEAGPPPAKHYDIYGPVKCECGLCKTWRERSVLAVSAAERAEGHGRSCMCPTCREKRAAQINLLVAENIRDIWTECSWAAWQEHWDPEWMVWLMAEFSDASRTKGWWSSQSCHFPMQFWYSKWDSWRHAKAAQASGRQAGTGR